MADRPIRNPETPPSSPGSGGTGENTEVIGKGKIEAAMRRLAQLREGEHAEAFSRNETVSGKQIFTQEDIKICEELLFRLGKEFGIGEFFINESQRSKHEAIRQKFDSEKKEQLTDSGRTVQAIIDEGRFAKDIFDLMVHIIESNLQIQNFLKKFHALSTTKEEQLSMVQSLDPQMLTNGLFIKQLFAVGVDKPIATEIVNKLPAGTAFNGYDFYDIADKLVNMDPNLCLALMKKVQIRHASLNDLYRLTKTLKVIGVSPEEMEAVFSKMPFTIDYADQHEIAALKTIPSSLAEIFRERLADDAKVSCLTVTDKPTDRTGWEKFLGKVSRLNDQSTAKLILYLREYPDLQQTVLERSNLFSDKKSKSEVVAFIIKVISDTYRLDATGEQVKPHVYLQEIRDLANLYELSPDYTREAAALWKQKAEIEQRLEDLYRDPKTPKEAIKKARLEAHNVQIKYIKSLFLAKSAALEKIPMEDLKNVLWVREYPENFMITLMDTYHREHGHGVQALCEKLPPAALALGLTQTVSGNIFFVAPYEALVKKAGGKEKVYGALGKLLEDPNVRRNFFLSLIFRGRLGEIIPTDEKEKGAFIVHFQQTLDESGAEDMDLLYAGIETLIKNPALGETTQRFLLKRYQQAVGSDEKTMLGITICKAVKIFTPEIQAQHESLLAEIQNKYAERLDSLERLPTEEWLADGKITIAKVFTPGYVLDIIRRIQDEFPQEKRAEVARIIFRKKSLSAALKDPLFDSLDPKIKADLVARAQYMDKSIKEDLEHQEGYMGVSVYELLKDGYRIVEGSFRVIDAKKGVFVTSDRVVLRKTINGKTVEMVCVRSNDPTQDMSAAFEDRNIDILELRAHCWDIDDSFMRKKNKPSHRKVVMIGACGGFANVGSIITHNIEGPMPQFIGTVGEGYGPINQTVTNALLDAVTSGRYRSWAEVGRYIGERLETEFRRPEDQDRVARYVLPGGFASLMTHLRGDESEDIERRGRELAFAVLPPGGAEE